MKPFSWNDHFNKIKNGSTYTDIIQCKVCGDLLYCSDIISIDTCGWEKLENSNQYICYTCGTMGYISQLEAAEIDKENEENFGTAINEDLNKPMRSQYTWDEHQMYNKEYKAALKDFLIQNDFECYTKYKDLFND